MLLLIILSYNILFIDAIQFKFRLSSSEIQCFKDDIPNGLLFVGEIQSSHPNFQFTLNKFTQEKEIAIQWVENEDKFKFHDIADQQGTYEMCFEANKDVDELLIQLKYETGGDALDMEEIAQKGQISFMNHTLTNIENLAFDIAEEKNKILSSEAKKTQTFSSFSQKYIGIGGITFGLMIIISGLQLYYLKRFFLYKKLV